MIKSYKYHLVVWVFLFLTGATLAQNSEISNKFTLGKDAYFRSKYSESISIFSELTKNNSQHEFAPYFYYYLACSYQNLGLFKDANFVWYQLISKYSTWKDLPLALYMKGVAQMEARNYVDALIQWSKITDPRLTQKIRQAKLYFFDKINTDTLQKIANRFPNDELLAGTLKARTNPTKGPSSFQVALLLPVDQLAKNGFVFDLYEGIKIGCDSLKKQNIHIDLILFDTGRDTLKLLSFVQDTCNAAMDLIIGPLYTFQQNMISTFSTKYTLPVVNPLSNNSYFALFQPNYFLWKPGYETMGRKAAQYAFKNFTRKANAAVVYGAESGDSIMAKAYRSEYEALGGKVMLFKKLPKDLSNYFGPVMNKVFPVIDTLGHLFVAANDPVLAANIFTYLETVLVDKAFTYKDIRTEEEKRKEEEEKRKKEELTGPKLQAKDIPIIAPAVWLDFSSISYDQFVLHDTHFIHPDFMMKDSIPNYSMYNTFLEKTGIIPSIYAYNGFELILYYGQMLRKYGKKKLYMMKTEPAWKNYMSSYVWYQGQNDNAYVPIVKISDYKLLLVNPPR